MAISLSSPITGASQTGLTSPTYTLTSDVAPDVNAKQWAVTALGGTQTGVTVHSVASPFTLTFWRPKLLSVLSAVSTATGVLLGRVPRNKYAFIVRKGMLPLANQPAEVGVVRCEIDLPAGADTYSPAEIRALLSAAIGGLSQISAGIGDTAVTGVM